MFRGFYELIGAVVDVPSIDTLFLHERTQLQAAVVCLF